WQAAKEMKAKAIICISRSGFTVRAIARFRPRAAILAFTPKDQTIRQLSMSWGATAYPIDRIDDNVSTVHRALEVAKARGELRTGDIVAVLAGSSATIGATDTLRMVRCP
ncbi:MAG: pyruvate kinase alpha/beta domain-containing protein, partial [Actinomycetota bacterium]